MLIAPFRWNEVIGLRIRVMAGNSLGPICLGELKGICWVSAIPFIGSVSLC